MDFSFLWTIHEIHVRKIQQCVVRPEVLDYVLRTDCYSNLDELHYEWWHQK